MTPESHSHPIDVNCELCDGPGPLEAVVFTTADGHLYEMLTCGTCRHELGLE